MKNRLIICAFFFIFSALSADIMEDAKKYQDAENWAEGYEDLRVRVPLLPDDSFKASMYTELSWITMEYADLREKQRASKGELFVLFEEAMEYGKKAVALGNPKGHFWYAANLGRWAETKGIFKALSRSEEMRDSLIKSLEALPDYYNSWNLMAKLYDALYLGRTSLKFGNRVFAVSYNRKALSVAKSVPDCGMLEDQMKILYQRNWSAEKRLEEKAAMKSGWESPVLVDKMAYFEYSVDFTKAEYWTNGKILSSLSDRDEAREAGLYLKKYLEELKSTKGSLLPSQQERYDRVVGMLKDWKFI
ncbi:MAG: hypothetical protein JXR63_10630 [Spirochaetales bacterium]|nr:hypothetical protein [Spirochaetales bacterium]